MALDPAAPPLTARFVAAMAVGAVALRDRMDDDEVRSPTALCRVCATDLGPACEAMSEDERAGRLVVRTESAGSPSPGSCHPTVKQLDRLRHLSGHLDLWSRLRRVGRAARRVPSSRLSPRRPPALDAFRESRSAGMNTRRRAWVIGSVIHPRANAGHVLA